MTFERAPDAAHVEVADLDELGEAVDARRVRAAQLLARHRAQRAHELHDCLTGAQLQGVTSPSSRHIV